MVDTSIVNGIINQLITWGAPPCKDHWNLSCLKCSHLSQRWPAKTTTAARKHLLGSLHPQTLAPVKARNRSIACILSISTLPTYVYLYLYSYIICGYLCAYLLFDQQLFHPETAILGEICGFRHTFTNSKFICGIYGGHPCRQEPGTASLVDMQAASQNLFSRHLKRLLAPPTMHFHIRA